MDLKNRKLVSWLIVCSRNYIDLFEGNNYYLVFLGGGSIIILYDLESVKNPNKYKF